MRKFNFVKLSILKILLIGGIVVLAFSCTTEIESPEKILAQMPSSTSLSSLSSSSGLALLSSSSSGVSSSSVYVSGSSGVEVSSSGGDSGSSSSVEIGSSSSVYAPSSSSVAVSSSSSVVASSSSSSIAASSSSSVVAGNVSCPNAVTGNNTVTCGGQAYKTVQIGDQIWMAENLNYDVPDNATDVCYDNNSNNCTTYGRLYNWATAMNLNPSCNSSFCSDQVTAKHRGICPSGWHIPSDDEWTTLTNYVESQGGCSYCSGTRLKATSGWNGDGNGDNHGFSALPGGYGNSGGSFANVGDYGFWWTSSELSSSLAYSRYMHYFYSDVSRYYDIKAGLFSVRCVQD